MCCRPKLKQQIRPIRHLPSQRGAEHSQACLAQRRLSRSVLQSDRLATADPVNDRLIGRRRKRRYLGLCSRVHRPVCRIHRFRHNPYARSEVARNRELADRLLGSALTLNILLGVPGLFILYFVANLQIFGLPSTTITAID